MTEQATISPSETDNQQRFFAVQAHALIACVKLFTSGGWSWSLMIILLLNMWLIWYLYRDSKHRFFTQHLINAFNFNITILLAQVVLLLLITLIGGFVGVELSLLTSSKLSTYSDPSSVIAVIITSVATMVYFAVIAFYFIQVIMAIWRAARGRTHKYWLTYSFLKPIA
ncbi:MAG: hypothetical protein Tsb005_19650 [Gammaproteobacteria bacterium]